RCGAARESAVARVGVVLIELLAAEVHPSAPVADFGDVAQRRACPGDLAADADAAVMDREHAAFVFARGNPRSTDRDLEIRPVMEARVVVADAGVVAAGRQ